MKINSINSINVYSNIKRNNIGKQQHKTNMPDRLPVSFPNNYNLTTFKAIPLEKLYSEYNWYINCDRIPAVNSFLKMDASKEVMNEFLTEILKTKDRGYQFIESIVMQPRNTETIMQGLENKLGKDSEHLLTFIPNSPYNNAYNNYIETKFLNARSLYELLKIRPDWKGSALIDKYIQIYGNDNLTIGRVPRQISVNHLYKIIDYLKGNMEIGIKSNKKIENLVLDGKTYEFKFFTEGKSSKNVFGLFVPSEGKKYVIKMENPDSRSMDAPFALGTLAKIDGYLTANYSRNSAPLCYYDHKNNFSIYKYIEHKHVNENPNDMSVIRKNLPDFKALGLQYNDTVGFKNFFTLNEHSSDTHYRMEGFKDALGKEEWISVDNDHVTYSNRLQPSVSKYHSSLPNAMQMFF